MSRTVIAALSLIVLTTAVAQNSIPQWQQCINQHVCPGSMTTVYSFFPKSTDAGYWPQTGLVRAGDGTFYGTTTYGGDLSQNSGRGYGTVFSLAGGKVTIIHSFSGYANGDGELPDAGMMTAGDGTLWGVAGGVIFQLGSDGSYQAYGPLKWTSELNRLTQGSDGNIYGTSFTGGLGINSYGAFFRFTPDGGATVLHSFSTADGINPTSVTEGTDGYFYGLTRNGGIFKISPSGDLTVIGAPTNTSNVYYPPRNGLTLGTDGNLYGTKDGISIFKLTPDGNITTIANLNDYRVPDVGSLVEAGDGNFYGASGNGVFQMTPGGAVTVMYAFNGNLELAGTKWDLAVGSDGLYGVSSAGGQACATLLPTDCDVGTSGYIFEVNTGGGDTQGSGGLPMPNSAALDAVDPNYAGLSSLLPVPFFANNNWSINSYNAFATSLHTVAALAADGVTPLVLRFRPTVSSGQVSFSIAGSGSGTLGCLDPLECPGLAAGMTTATATVQTLADGSYAAFALLQAPLDFVRSGPQQAADTAAQTRQITITAKVVGSSSPAQSMTLTLWRPPVVLLHGLWSNACTWTLTLPGFVHYAEDYEATNSSRFAVNAFEPQRGIQHVLQGMRAAGIAVTQADFVGHSMGGLLARLYAGEANPAVPYKRADNLGYGDIHKLITLDTPHLGSELANALVDSSNNLTDLGEAFQAAVEAAGFSNNFKACRPTASTANFLPPYCATCGAILDLSAGGAVLASMPEVDVPSHAIVGVGGSTALNDLSDFTQAMSVFGGPAGDVAEILGHVVDWYQGTFFNNAPHDLIVSKDSQIGALTGRDDISIFDADPATSSWAVHFTVTGEQPIANEIISLLNAPTKSPSFGNFPATASPLSQQGLRPQRPRIRRQAIRISSPRSSTVLAPNDVVPVTIEAVPEFVPARILLIAGRRATILRGASSTSMLRIPADAGGDLGIVALAIDDNGVIAVSPRITLRVKSRR